MFPTCSKMHWKCPYVLKLRNMWIRVLLCDMQTIISAPDIRFPTLDQGPKSPQPTKNLKIKIILTFSYLYYKSQNLSNIWDNTYVMRGWKMSYISCNELKTFIWMLFMTACPLARASVTTETFKMLTIRPIRTVSAEKNCCYFIRTGTLTSAWHIW